jgi:DNA polymerase-3 subunit epsilon
MNEPSPALESRDDFGTPFADMPFIVVDVETTGVSAWYGDRVTEVAAVLVQRGRVVDAFQSLVNPQRRIPSYITQLTGISNAMVRHAPRFEQIAGDLAAELVGRVFVAHNATFDWNFLSAEYDRLPAARLGAIANARLCTVRLARRFLSHLPRRNLDAVAWHYGVSIEGRHRAAGDARATALVLLGLLRDAERWGVHTWEALDGLMAKRTRRTRRRSALPRWSDGREGA